MRLLVLVVQDLLMCHSEGVGQLLALSSRTLRGRWFVSPRQESFGWPRKRQRAGSLPLRNLRL